MVVVSGGPQDVNVCVERIGTLGWVRFTSRARLYAYLERTAAKAVKSARDAGDTAGVIRSMRLHETVRSGLIAFGVHRLDSGSTVLNIVQGGALPSSVQSRGDSIIR